MNHSEQVVLAYNNLKSKATVENVSKYESAINEIFNHPADFITLIEYINVTTFGLSKIVEFDQTHKIPLFKLMEFKNILNGKYNSSKSEHGQKCLLETIEYIEQVLEDNSRYFSPDFEYSDNYIKEFYDPKVSIKQLYNRHGLMAIPDIKRLCINESDINFINNIISVRHRPESDLIKLKELSGLAAVYTFESLHDIDPTYNNKRLYELPEIMHTVCENLFNYTADPLDVNDLLIELCNQQDKMEMLSGLLPSHSGTESSHLYKGSIPEYLKKHHDLSYGETDSDIKPTRHKKSDDSDNDDIPDETDDIPISDKEETDTEKNSENDSKPSSSSSTINYYYTSYYNSNNTDNSVSKRIKSDNINPTNEGSDLYKENSDDELSPKDDLTIMDLTIESPIKEEMPESDRPIRDFLTDVDSKSAEVQQKMKGAIQDAEQTVGIFIKPAQRFKQWSNSIINRYKGIKKDKLKDKIANPKERNLIWEAFRKSVISGSLLRAGILLHPIFIFLFITAKIDSKRKFNRIRSEVFTELRNEIKIIDTKIEDANKNNDNDAKYKLMRLKNEIERKMVEVGAKERGARKFLR